MWLSVNGEKKQDSSSANLAFKVPHLVSYISQFMSLEPGDIISTGTPPGWGRIHAVFERRRCGLSRTVPGSTTMRKQDKFCAQTSLVLMTRRGQSGNLTTKQTETRI
jgi:2-keto-4-pentenoate hydratase/2-oxohepta-3-ene-1,7-dioic acid hydratase in catechol pathway